MQSILSVALLALAGVLVGGAYSIRSQGGSRAVVIGFIALAVLAAAGGVLWMI